MPVTSVVAGEMELKFAGDKVSAVGGVVSGVVTVKLVMGLLLKSDKLPALSITRSLILYEPILLKLTLGKVQVEPSALTIASALALVVVQTEPSQNWPGVMSSR